jgi:Tol biopolymer transport system component
VKVLRLADNSVSQLNTTVQDATDISSLRWSPDGKKLLCTIKRNYQQGCDIYVIDAEGGRVSNITRGMAAYDSISWSKDGKKILFSCDKDANSDVYLMNADGTGLINITQSRENELLPAWSPDGSGMAWLKFPPRIKDTWASAFDLCIADASGAATDIIPGFLGPEWSPLSSWAPDGGRMIVGTKNGDSYNLTLVDLRTKERTEFTNGRCEITYNYSSQYPENEGIRWLSDGSGIAFQGEGWGILSGDGSSDVFVCSFETMELTNCTRSDDPYLWYGFARTRQ